MLSVCHIASAEEWGGAEAHIATLTSELSQYPELSIRVLVLGEGRLGRELRARGVEIDVIRDAGGRFFRCYHEAVKRLANRNVDILHSHKSKENVLAMLLGYRCGIPY